MGHESDRIGNHLFPPFFESLVDEAGGRVSFLVLFEHRFPRAVGQIFFIIFAVERTQGVVVSVAGIHGKVGGGGVASHFGHEGGHARHRAGHGGRLGYEVHLPVLRVEHGGEAVVHAASHVAVLPGSERSEVAPTVVHAVVYRVDLTFEQFALRREQVERIGPVKSFIKVGHESFRVMRAGTVSGYVVDVKGDETLGCRGVGGVVAVVGGAGTAEKLWIRM